MWKRCGWLGGLFAALAMGVAAQSLGVAQDEAGERDLSKSKQGAKVIAAKMYRASTLNGMEVRNLQNESVGKIHDLVLDIESGKIGYAAVSVGGFLGVGDKLFAIPWNSFTFKHAEDDQFFILDITKERLKAAPGFDQDNWPNVADPKWREQVDSYYAQRRENQTRK